MKKYGSVRAYGSAVALSKNLCDIEPYRNEHYISVRSALALLRQQYNEFQYQKIYNYYIHPQWDNMGSSAVYQNPLRRLRRRCHHRNDRR